MLGASNGGRGIVHLARLGLQERDELSRVRRIEAWMCDNNQRRPRDESDRSEIRQRIVAHLPVYALIDSDFRGRTDEQSMSVGCGLATAFAPIIPPAPPRFSTTNACPRTPLRRSASNRARKSVAPPGGYATTILTGFSGQPCANTVVVESTTNAIAIRHLGMAVPFPMSCGVNFALRIAVVFRKRSGMASERRYVDCLWPPVRQAVKGITVAASQ